MKFQKQFSRRNFAYVIALLNGSKAGNIHHERFAEFMNVNSIYFN